MRLYKIEPYLDGRERDKLLVVAYDYDDARRLIEETSILDYDCYSVGYNLVEVEDLAAELERGQYYGIIKSMLW